MSCSGRFAACSRLPRPPVEDPVLGVMEGGEPEEPEPVASVGLVLVAASDANLVKLVGYRLELGGFEVATAHDPAEALQVAAERRPTCASSTGRCPPIDGIPVKMVDPTMSVHELYLDVERTLAAAGTQRAAEA